MSLNQAANHRDELWLQLPEDLRQDVLGALATLAHKTLRQSATEPEGESDEQQGPTRASGTTGCCVPSATFGNPRSSRFMNTASRPRASMLCGNARSIWGGRRTGSQ